MHPIPSNKPNEIINISTDVAKMVMKLPKKYNTPPSTPTDRMENFLANELTNSPAKLNAQKHTLIIIVMELVAPPRLVMKSLNINPKDANEPKKHALNQMNYFRF